MIVAGIPAPLSAQKGNSKDTPKQAPELPPELSGAKIYHLPDKSEPGKPAEDPVIYKNISYNDINFERLLLNVSVAVKPIDRAATIKRIYFQNVRVEGIPVHLDTFDQEFKVSKKDVVDLPAPLHCSVVFTDLVSLAPLKQLLEEQQIRITGQSFIEVKLNSLEKFAVGGKQVVLPVELNETMPFQFLPDNPLMQTAAKQIIDTICDPTSATGLALAAEHLAKLTQQSSLSGLAQSAVYLIYCEYALENPQTHGAEKFAQSGTGFVVTADGKLLTAKRVIQPWKFDPQVALLMKSQHVTLVDKSYKLAAWPVGAAVLTPDGQLNFQSARASDQNSLRVLKSAPDQMTTQNYRDPDSGESAVVEVHATGDADLALLQISGSGFQPLGLEEAGAVSLGAPGAMVSFPFGLSQPLATPKLTMIKTSQPIALDQPLNPGEAGAPLIGADGKVLAMAGEAHECIAADALRRLLQ